MKALLHLSDSERAAVRRCGGAAYMGVVFAHGVRGRRYRPRRTAVYRTEEGAQRELDAFRVDPRVLVSRREVVVVDARPEQEV
jgi:hypothetical protein